ncbi:MAG TPA: GGDEF domain-containing protein, partial [Epsilonproteobacteria bacterium]|nr:GGDEF domain-containing protein [Campylobacterota bacterium]
MRSFSNIYIKLSALINTGLQDGFTYNEKRYLQFSNLAALVTFFAAFNGVLIYIYEMIYLPSGEQSLFQLLISLVLVISTLLVLYLNKKHYYETAKELLLLAPLVVITTLAICVQKETGDYLYFFLAPVGIFFFLGLNRKSYIWVASTFLILLLTLYYQANYPPLIPVSKETENINYIVTLINIFVILTILTSFLIRTNKNMEEQLTELMETDHLTGLYNRRKYSNYSEQLYHAAKNEKLPLSILIFDIDHFKAYNDTYGHLRGDSALKRIADILNQHIKENDHMFRFGGEEFVAILTNTSLEKAIQLAQKIQTDIRDEAIEHKTSSTHDCMTCSVGIASQIPNNDVAYSELFEKADKNLYLAKDQGRNRIV